jgi:hypothetical protein
MKHPTGNLTRKAQTIRPVMMPRQNDLLGEQKGYYTNQGRKIASNEIMGYHTKMMIEIN